jgi:PPOX class probable F420-dependent enzyme
VTVRLDDTEAADFLASSHTGVLATIRSDGSPALVPLWFVMVGGQVCLRTPGKSAKVSHIRRDPRVSFLVESGRAWAELKAVVLYGRAELVKDADVMAQIDEAFAAKYADHGLPANAPARTRAHYAAERAHIRVTVTRRSLTWDNSKLLADKAISARD